jgi:hypothetical protein
MDLYECPMSIPSLGEPAGNALLFFRPFYHLRQHTQYLNEALFAPGLLFSVVSNTIFWSVNG